MSWYQPGEQQPPQSPPPRQQAPPPPAAPGGYQPRYGQGAQRPPEQPQEKPAYQPQHGPGGPAPGRSRGGLALTPLAGVTALAAAVFAASGWLPWLSLGGDGPSLDFQAYDLPAKYLFDSTAEAGGPSLGLVVVVLGVLALVTALLRPVRLLAPVLGLLTAVVVGLFVFQSNVGADDLGADVGLFDLLGFGVYVAGAAALVLLVVGLASSRS